MQREAVEFHRRAGAKIDEALKLASRDLGISPRRTRQWRYETVPTIHAEEADTIRAAWKRLSARRANVARLRAELAAEMKALEAEA